jgi:hypothetical protein
MLHVGPRFDIVINIGFMTNSSQSADGQRGASLRCMLVPDSKGHAKGPEAILAIVGAAAPFSRNASSA